MPIKSINNISEQVLEYDKKLPRRLDIVILSVGDDGHVASIFDKSAAAVERRRYFIESSSPVAPNKRATLTFPAIMNAKRIYILGITKHKRNLLELVNNNRLDYRDMPLKKVIKGKWITEEKLDEAANLLLDSIIIDLGKDKR